MAKTTLKGAYLSLQQDRLWSFQQEGGVYRSQCSILIKGILKQQAFQRALQQLVEQHTLFQTVFSILPGMDMPVQVLGQQIEFACPTISLENIPEPGRRAVLHTLLTSLQETSFNLSYGPLFYVMLFPLSAEEALLFINLSALYADAATLPLLIADLMKRYHANLAGQERTLEPLQYTAVCAWQKQLLLKEDKAAKAAREFWKRYALSQVAQVQRLLERAKIVKPGSLWASETPVFKPLSYPLAVEEAASLRIHALAAHYGVSVTAILLACWLIVLWRLTGEPQMLLGVACNGRGHEELAEVLGHYTRFVPFTAYVREDWTFGQIVAFVEPMLEATRKHQFYFTWPAVANEHDPAIKPNYFPVTFEHEHWPASFAGEELSLSLEQQSCCTEPFMLKLSVLQVGERLQLDFCYDPQYCVTTSIPRLASMLQVLLHSVTQQPQEGVGALTLITARERKRLLMASCAPVRSQTAPGLHRLFEEQVEQVPGQLAAISAQEQLTYRQLNESANRLARVLRGRGVGPNILVGLCMARGAQMLVGLLAILKAGGAYLPLDAASPCARLTYQLQESQVALLLTQREVNISLPEWEGSMLYLEDLEHELSQVRAENLSGGATAGDLAYVIYTSGSTGLPKGVMISQSSVVNYSLALCEVLKVESGWHYATVSTLAADLGNTAIWCALVSGGCVQVLDAEIFMNVEALARWVEQHPIDVLKIVPSHLSALLTGERSSELLPRRALVLGGEALSASLLARVSALGGSCEVYNHYGPTEATVGVLLHALGVLAPVEEGSERWEQVPLGRPLTNTEVYILDRHMQPVPVGVTGELYIGGAGLACGYVQQAEQTAEYFVPHPFVEAMRSSGSQAGARLYRTGDLARYSGQGEIEFVGRGDSQVKLRGYRIELTEIEAVLSQHPNVRDSVVVLEEDEGSSPQLVGYIVPRKQPLSMDMQLGDFLREHVPEYMIPSIFVYLKFLPLTANGKVNRHQLARARSGEENALPALIVLDSPTRTVVQPRDAIEWQLLQIWEDLLQRQPISIVDDFFRLGGHSLLAVRLMSRIAERFGQDLSLATLFQHPTVATLAVVLRQHTVFEDRSPLAAIQTRGTRPPFFCVHPSGGTAFCYVDLARRLGPDQPFYGLHTPDRSHVQETLATVEEMAARYIAAIRTVQPQGPYLVGGWSAGGIVAFEIAQQLQRLGQVGVLAIIDSMLVSAQEMDRAREEEIDLGDTGVVKELLNHFKISIPDDFKKREVDAQLSYAVEQTKKVHAVPEDASIDFVSRYTRTSLLNKHIVHKYAAQPYPHQVDYFASSQSLERAASLDEREDPMPIQRWRELAQGGMRVHVVPGDHQSLVTEPQVRVLANALKQCIDRVCEQLAEA